MTDTYFPQLAEDGPEDLPRTLRRAREAQQRETREREARRDQVHEPRAEPRTPVLNRDSHEDGYEPPSSEPMPAVVSGIEVPFLRLMLFFIKAVFAAIPALVILGVLLWLAGATLKALYPQLVHTEILIRVPR